MTQNRSYFSSLLVFAIGLFGLTSCSKNYLTGQGATLTETRSISSFSQVVVSGQPQVDIYKSNESKIEITGYANLVSAYKTEVSNNRLCAGYRNFTVVRHDNISLKIYTNDLNKIDLSGLVSLRLHGDFSGQEMNMQLSGDTKVEILGDCSYNQSQFDISGRSRIMARKLNAQQSRVHSSGESFIELTATEKLRVDISGKSDVYYWGNPSSVEQDISGDGRLVKK